MKLLLDENLSFRMLAELEPIFPGSCQVRLLGLERADDRTLWRYAREHGFALLTQDADFQELATLYGAPPKVIWLTCGNRRRDFITRLLLTHREALLAFTEDPATDVLEIGG